MAFKRQQILQSILDGHFQPGNPNMPGLTIAALEENGLYQEIVSIYRSLGGILELPPLGFGSWDLVYEDFIVELDEEQHFNRYRAFTLNSSIYFPSKYFNVSDYRLQCKIKEPECIKKASRGKYWTSNSTEKQFGKASPRGDLNRNGSPRWKQRAFYDFLRDVSSLIYQIPVVRISIYDEIPVDKVSMNNILTRYQPVFDEYVVNLVNQRKGAV